MEEEFIAVRQDLERLKVHIGTEKAWIEGEVSRVEGQMLIQRAMINAMRQRITILQKQDWVIIKEAGENVEGIRKQILDSMKKQIDNRSTLLNHRRCIMKIHEDVDVRGVSTPYV
jgi:hypothetical protein